MTIPRRILDDVAAAVADGHQVDWPEVHRRLDGSDSAGTAAALEEIDSLGRGSRSVPLGRRPNRRLHPYLVLMIPAVVLQVLVGVGGYFFGPETSIPVPGWLLLIITVIFTGSGVVVAVAGRWDLRTAPLAGFFLSIASAPAISLVSFTTTGYLRVLFSALLFEAFFPFFIWWFVERFPRVVRVERRGRWISWAKGSSLMVGSLFFCLNAIASYPPAGSVLQTHVPFALRSTAGGYWLTLFFLALPAPLVVFTRLRHARGEERRRAKLFMVGLAIGILPMILVVLAEILFPSLTTVLARPMIRAIQGIIAYGFMLTIPITLGSAAVARHAFDFHFAVGRAARAMLARRLLWFLAVVPWLILAGILWIEREHSLSALFQKPGPPVLVVLGVLGFVLIQVREYLLHGIEHRLLRRPGAPGAAIAAFSHRLSAVRDDQELAEVVGEFAPGLVQAESCVFMMRSERDKHFLSITGGNAPLDSDTALVQLAAASPDPISTDERDRDSWLVLLPESDRLWVADGNVHLVLPVTDSAGECRAMIAFGPSLSGGVYSAADLDVASAAASTVSLALARLGSDANLRSPASAPISETPAGECMACGRIAESSGRACECGGPFRSAAIPYLLGDKFRLERVLGRGGMGVVYLARDLALDRQVALKTLPRMRSGSLMRLRREARSMASFVHPNLALIFGAETWRGVPVLVVEYLRGGTLSRLIGNRHDPVFVVELGVKLAGALSALHRKGLLHRDVKPANIGFTEQWEPKLLDFGLAQIIEETHPDLEGTIGQAIRLESDQPASLRLTETSHVVGTPLYLSPEILAGDDPSPEQDLWALHVVLWEVVAGRHPLHGLGIEAAVESLMSEPIPPIRTASPTCPDVLAEILDRGLSRRRVARLASADLLERELVAARSELSLG